MSPICVPDFQIILTAEGTHPVSEMHNIPRLTGDDLDGFGDFLHWNGAVLLSNGFQGGICDSDGRTFFTTRCICQGS